MTMATNKPPTTEGTLYSKPIKRGITKDGKPYEIYQIVLEIDGSYKDRNGNPHDKKSLMIFDVSNNVKSNLDLYNIKDVVIVTYKMAGNCFKRKDGSEGFDNKLFAIGMNHADLDANRDTHKGKILIDSDFVAPDLPSKDDPDDSDLPF